MRQDFFEYLPTYKLIVVGNHRPRLENVGEAMRRRLHLVPFTVTIPKANRERNLAEVLWAERDGILGWMLAGYAAWRRLGLDPPQRVLSAGRQYFEDEDIVGHWIDECCLHDPAIRTPSRVLFANWRSWAETVGHPVGQQKTLTEALNRRGFASFRSATVRGIEGLKLRRGATP